MNPHSIKGTALALVVILLLSAVQCRATGTIEANYRTAMRAYHAKDWERAERLAKVTLEQIESRAWKDWLYRGDKQPTVGYFTGDLVYTATSEGESWWQSQVEIYDPLGDMLVQVNDYKPWHIDFSLHTPGYTLTFLSRSEYFGKKIIWFEAGKPETERSMLRDKIEEIVLYDITQSFTSIDRTTDTDYVVMCEKGPRGWGLSIFDPATGEIETVHDLAGLDMTKCIQRQVKLHKGIDYWTFLDGNKLYALDPGTWKKRLLYTLPFTVAVYDHFQGEPFEKLAAVRGDTLYMLRETSPADYELRTVRLPFPVSSDHWMDKIDFDGSGAWLAQSDADSLRIFKISGTKALYEHSTASCVGRSCLVMPELISTFWKGDTLIHFGPSGLKVFKGTRLLHAADAADMRAFHLPERDLLVSYRAPDEFSVFDIGDLKIRWRREFAVPQLEFFDIFDDDYLLINHIDGMSLLDIETGEELLQVSGKANLVREVNREKDRVLLGGDNFLGVYEIPNPRKYRGNLVAITALGKWAAQDTAGALRDVRWALSSGMTLSGDLPESILAMLQSLDLRKEANRLMGKMAIRTNDELWRKKLGNEGMEFLVQPNISEFNAIFKLDNGITSFPVLIYPFSVAKGENRAFYWFESPDYDTELMMLPACGFSITREHLFMFEYRTDDTGENVVWYPFLCNESMDIDNLGPLITTPITRDSESQVYIEYAVEKPPFNSYTDKRAVTEICLRRGGGGKTSSRRTFYTAGIDLTSGGENWYDSTLVDPLRIGNRYFAHRYYCDPITRIVDGTQADSIGLKVGDLVISFAGYPVSNTTPVGIVKTFFPDRHPIDITVLRGADTLSFTVLNGRIGYEHWYSHKLVEIDPETGRHITEIDLPHLYGIKGYNSSGELVYSWSDTLLFFDPLSMHQKKVVVAGIDGYRRFRDDFDHDILLLRRGAPETIIAVDVSKTADDADRVLWKETIENPYRLYGEARYPYSSVSEHLHALLEDGTLLIYDVATGSVIARESLPFRNFGLLPQIWDGILYGTAAGKIFGWKVAYYNPPFPWKYAGFGAAAFVPLLLVSILLNRHRIVRLKARQLVELKRAEIDAEISAARKLQAGLIPMGVHTLGSFSLVGKFIPAWEVAGDYFDFRLLDDGRLVVVIGDVAGHGLPAGILVSMAKASLMTLSRNGDTDLTHTLESLNEVIRNGSPEKPMFMTICYLIIDPANNKIRCSANGHPFPLIARKDGTCEEIGGYGGYPLGVREKQSFQVVETDFLPGDTLLSYTDGLPEQVNPSGEPWGYDNFIATFCAHARGDNLEEMVDRIFRDALQYTGGIDDMEDDMALVAIRYKSG